MENFEKFLGHVVARNDFTIREVLKAHRSAVKELNEVLSKWDDYKLGGITIHDLSLIVSGKTESIVDRYICQAESEYNRAGIRILGLIEALKTPLEAEILKYLSEIQPIAHKWQAEFHNLEIVDGVFILPDSFIATLTESNSTIIRTEAAAKIYENFLMAEQAIEKALENVPDLPSGQYGKIRESSIFNINPENGRLIVNHRILNLKP